MAFDLAGGLQSEQWTEYGTSDNCAALVLANRYAEMMDLVPGH